MSRGTRLSAVDCVRAAAIISMILYHGFWDLCSLDFLPGGLIASRPAVIWQRSIAFTFIAVSGFCFSLSKKPIKNGLILFLLGAGITAVTAVFMPQNIIIFGILTFLGSAALVTALFDFSLKKISPCIGLIISLILFILAFDINAGYLAGLPLPTALYKNYITAFFGFPFRDFFSVDYFSLFPWFFLYLAGYYLFKLCKRLNLLCFLRKPDIRPLTFIGRHSLVIYLIHQPIIYGILCLIPRL